MSPILTVVFLLVGSQLPFPTAANVDCPTSRSGWFSYRSQCFYVPPDKKNLNWQQARDYCISQNMDLAQPKSVQGLGAALFPIGHTYYWLGADNTQKWLDGTRINEWYQGEPKSGNNCVTIHPVYCANSLFSQPCHATEGNPGQDFSLVCEKSS